MSNFDKKPEPNTNTPQKTGLLSPEEITILSKLISAQNQNATYDNNLQLEKITGNDTTNIVFKLQEAYKSALPTGTLRGPITYQNGKRYIDGIEVDQNNRPVRK